jgi:benzylsuccinate CoA-transferase BbsF subunit
VLENWGLSYAEMKKINPDIILVRNSNQGQTGPAAKQPGLGNHINGLAGIVNMVGWPNKEPISLQVAYSDYVVPHFAAAVLIGALDYRRRTGKGQELDIAKVMIDGVQSAYLPTKSGRPFVRLSGSRHGSITRNLLLSLIAKRMKAS